MIVDGKEFQVGYEEIAAGEIDFDPDNPRRYEIALELESRGQDPNEARKADGIEKATRFQELVKSVVENGGISIPMVVERVDGTSRLIDGDRRLGAVRYILAHDEILQENPDLKANLGKLPCMVVKGPLTEEERLRLLAHIHIHLAPWRPAAKDYVADKLFKTAGEPKTKTVTRTTKGSIEKAKLVEDYKRLFSFKGAQAVSWSKELANIRQSLIDDEVVTATVEKAREGKITSAVHVRDLRTILKDPDARALYVRAGTTIEDARRVRDLKELSKAIEKPDVPFKDYVEKLLIALRNVKFEELVKYKGDQDVAKMVDECMTLLGNFKAYI
jgi:ParB-like chromosome segregation protein Spo0J